MNDDETGTWQRVTLSLSGGASGGLAFPNCWSGLLCVIRSQLLTSVHTPCTVGIPSLYPDCLRRVIK